MSLPDSQRMLLATGPVTESQVRAMVERERALPMPPVSSPAYECYRQIYSNFDAQLSRCEGNCELAIGLLTGLMTDSDVDTVLSFRRSRSAGGAADAAANVLPPASALADAAVTAAAPNVPPPPADEDTNCPGLQLPRPDGDVRTIDVCRLAPEHLWHLFLNASVNGGYLGKSVIHFLVQKFEAFASAYPSGKFSKTSPQLEQQRQCFIAFCNTEAGHLIQVQDFIMSKIPTLPSLRSKMRCVNVPARLEAAAAQAGVAAAAAAAEPVKAIMDDNLHCKVVLFLKFSETNRALAQLFGNYYGNEQSRSRHAADTAGFRCAIVLHRDI